jgi:death-on-curing protein
MSFTGVVYLNKDIVLEIHRLQLEEHGGADGIRDHGGLDSAIAQPQASFGDEDLHATIFDKAAAYAFHLSEAQAFVDGNKRVGLASALTFLALNGYEFSEDQPEFYDAMIAIAKHQLDKDGLSTLIRDCWIKANIPK